MRLFVLAMVWASLALALAAQSTSAAEGQGKADSRCQPGNSHLLVADAQAQVYVTKGEDAHYAGCVYGSRKSYKVGIPAGGDANASWHYYAYTLAGPVLAYAESATEGYGQKQKDVVVVRDLLNGKVLHYLPTGTAPANADRVGIGNATAVVVEPDGAVAWIVEAIENAVPKDLITYQVHAVDQAGTQVLASGPDIEPSSLALAGSTLYWTQGGMPFSAPLD